MATLEVMTERGRLDPDVGYWAEQWDPGGRVHPLYYTFKVGDRWVQATTLPLLYAAWPLYRLGGYRLALLLPMLGSVAAALAARALARRIGGGEGWAAFWLVGLASPLTIYALDFWEHSVGVAATAWAVVLLVDLVERRRGWPAALGAGALLGLAATMRTEALVYAFVAVGLACVLVLVQQRRPVAALSGGALAVVGLALPMAANHALEVATVGEGIRFRRASGIASTAVTGAGDVAGTRIEEAALTAAGLSPSLTPGSYLVGGALLALLAFAAYRASRPGDAGPAVLAGAGAAALYLIRFADGPGFVPGLVAATPLAVVALVLGWSSSPAARYVLGVAVLALPLVWATQYQGGAAPQWAGRYILVSGLLLAAVGVTALPRLRVWARAGFVGLAVVVTVFGLAWAAVRSGDIARALRSLSARPEPVLVSRVAHLAREGGAFYGEHRWLSVASAADERLALDMLAGAGIDTIALVQLSPVGAGTDRALDGWRPAGRDQVELFPGDTLDVLTYEATGR